MITEPELRFIRAILAEDSVFFPQQPQQNQRPIIDPAAAESAGEGDCMTFAGQIIVNLGPRDQVTGRIAVVHGFERHVVGDLHGFVVRPYGKNERDCIAAENQIFYYFAWLFWCKANL